jgi:hypothetical protein
MPPQEATEHIAQFPPRQWMPAERNTGDVFFIHSGEMAENIAGFSVAENKPWLALVGKPIVNVDTDAFGRQHPHGAIK